ncbi:MAG: hypothetical protein KAT65_09750 [Methanophagales archaeon]|nr:hypothetical protein [Methanophagales archaeon]
MRDYEVRYMSKKTFRYTKTVRDQIALYSIDPYWLNERIKGEKWKSQYIKQQAEED